MDGFADWDAMMAAWNAGWEIFELWLAGVTDADLGRVLRIRGEEHTLALALTRSSTHVSYHSGQIVQAARILASRAGRRWKVLAVPRGGSVAFNRAIGFDSSKPT